jgi:hypothetical protein
MTFSDSASGDEQQAAPGVEAFGEVAVDSVQQPVDRLVTMVARDVRVQVEPEALDPVLVGAVRRQEVQPQPVTELRQPW